MNLFDQNDEELKKQILLRSLIGGDETSYNKPMIGNEQTAHVARGLSNAADLFVGRKPRFEQSKPESALDTAIKYNQLQTGTPEFKREEAQIRANMELQSQLDADEAKKKRAREDYKAALDARGNGQQSMQSMPQAGPTLPTAMPSKGGEVPQYIPFTTPGKYDPTLGTFGPDEIDYKENKEYVKPEDRKAIEEKDNMLKETIEQNLRSIKEAKKGEKYFGRIGDWPSLAAPSSIPVVGKMFGGRFGIGDEYADRQKWETNINQLLSEKVVDLMTRMKQSSKTGATGFGALNKTELDTLRNASTVLNKKLDGKDALVYLKQMEKIEKKMLDSLNNTKPIVDKQSLEAELAQINAQLGQ